MMSESTNILLVEDDRHIALALQIRLSAAGHGVHVAASVAEANQLLNAHTVNVAVIDVNLPDGNGVEFMRSIAAMDLDAPILSIIMSASRRLGLRDEALAAGASAFLEKPFSSATLLEAVTANDTLLSASGSCG